MGLEAQVGVVFAGPDSRQLRGHGDWTGHFRGKHGPIEALPSLSLFLFSPLSLPGSLSSPRVTTRRAATSTFSLVRAAPVGEPVSAPAISLILVSGDR